MDKKTIEEIFRRFAEKNPHPKTELEYKNEFTLLVAIILSAQSTDVGVNKATRGLFKVADSAQKMVALGEENLRLNIRTIGLFNSKAKNIISMSKILLEKYAGKVPHTREELEQLPGVGRKTANVFLNCALGQPTIAVDTHVQRVANRIGLARSKTPKDTENQLLKIITEPYLMHAHHWLILHGRYVCKARKPNCSACEITDLCQFENKTV